MAHGTTFLSISAPDLIDTFGPRGWELAGLKGVRRPRLLALVYASSLVLLALTVGGLMVAVNGHITAATLNATAAADRELVNGHARAALQPDDLRAGASPERAAQIEADLDEFAAAHDLLAVTVSDGAGALLYETGASLPPGVAPDAAAARGGRGTVELIELPGATPLVVQQVPLTGAGRVLAVVTLVRDASPLLAAADAAVRDVLVIMVAGAAVLAVLLLFIFRAAQQLLARRTAQLLESTRHDPLTGMLNHGAIVALLTSALETARRGAGWFVVALVDIDGFRLLNETHGHDAGDRTLLAVADALQREVPRAAWVGRYGPDEFLLVGLPEAAPDIRPAIERLRAHLANMPLRFEGAEPLTVSVSAGVASYPEHAASASELLAAATEMLLIAKTAGGDEVRVDAPEDSHPGRWSGFDVLHGLVASVDAKDRYTRRHSEDVTRYAGYLADHLQLNDVLQDAVRLAGLLHDVGKIGVPDPILRKPGPLTAEEKDVMSQHVVLGDLIVRGMPEMGLVAAGVRHHHERWDGEGYPDGLRGEGIPTIARIIAIADSFSAMTTSRPYRKGVPVDEALRRITDGAGTQWDPQLAATFVQVVAALPADELPETEAPPASRSRLGNRVA